ncbi:tRNA uridine-5-carboxymethylaminomethyl(34) synthesis GTPase MnmE, partial [Vibrio vulnificus]|nr:tRNA uridine-5-carboxymethylaminomethyl(34) synthesis GTPase MnmE [Vibrio vulnificus]
DTDIATRLPEGVPVVHVFNKADAVQVADAVSLNALAQPDGPVLTLSARTGEGLQALRHTLLEIAGWQAAPEGVFIARQRHVQALRQARSH